MEDMENQQSSGVGENASPQKKKKIIVVSNPQNVRPNVDKQLATPRAVSSPKTVIRPKQLARPVESSKTILHQGVEETSQSGQESTNRTNPIDTKQLIDNVYALIKCKNLRIGDVERTIGVSSGYFSRLAKNENDVAPGLDVVYKLAQILEITVDSLLNSDFTKSQENVAYLEKFIKKIVTDIESGRMDWESFCDYDEVEQTYGFYEVPMLQDGQFVSMLKKNERMQMKEPHYLIFLSALGPTFLFRLERKQADKVTTEYEIYFLQDASSGEECTLACSSLENEGVLRPFLLELYNCFERHDTDVRIPIETRAIIDRYMESE